MEYNYYYDYDVPCENQNFTESTNLSVSVFPSETDLSNSKLSGKFIDAFGDYVYIKKVIYNDPATIVFWSDGTKTICKCNDGDIYNAEQGLVLCVLKKVVTPTQVFNLLRDWLPEQGGNIVTLKHVRSKSK